MTRNSENRIEPKTVMHNVENKERDRGNSSYERINRKERKEDERVGKGNSQDSCELVKENEYTSSNRKTNQEDLERNKELSWKTRNCKFYLQNRCKHSDSTECRFIHPNVDKESMEDELNFLEERLKKMRSYLKYPMKRD